MFFGAIAVDDEHLELGGVRVLVGLLDEISERLQEALARRAVLRSEQDNHMRCSSPDKRVLH